MRRFSNAIVLGSLFTGLPGPCSLGELSGEGAEAKARVEKEGGYVLGGYHDPLGNHPLIFAVLPIDAIEPTPFQRDLSDMHHKRLADVLDRTGMFLDPVIAVADPLPPGLENIFSGFNHVLVVEMNDEGLYGFGQLGALLRSRYCDAKIQGINKTDGLTWKVKDILERAKANVSAGLRKI